MLIEGMVCLIETMFIPFHVNDNDDDGGVVW